MNPCAGMYIAASICSAFFSVSIHSVGNPFAIDGKIRFEKTSLMNRIFSRGSNTSRSPPVWPRPRNNTSTSVPPIEITRRSATTSAGRPIRRSIAAFENGWTRNVVVCGNAESPPV